MARLRLSLGVAVIGTALGLTGCPSSSTPSSVPIEMLGATYGSISCSLIRDCYGDALAAALTGSTSETACVTRAEGGYTNGALPRYQAAIAMGTMTYDGSQAGACVDALRAEGCAAVSSRAPAACDALFVGHVALGGACALDEECVGDAYCSVTTACPGTCQSYGGPGAACTRDQACQSGLRCGNGTCQAPGGAGASCQGTTGVECGGGLICAGGSSMRTGTCTAVTSVFAAGSGQACNVAMSQLCASGLSCIVMSATSQTCGTGGLASGAGCNLALPDQCAAGLYCNGPDIAMGRLTGTCAVLPTAGMPCATVLAGQACADGHTCDSGTCVEVQENGGACTVDSDCFGSHCVSGVCTAPTYCPS